MIEQTKQKIHELDDLHFKLLLIVGLSNSGKTKLIKRLNQEVDSKYLNLNEELSRRLLDISAKDRGSQAIKELNNIIDDNKDELLILDNTELLFNPSLGLRPLDYYKQISRVRKIVVCWNGTTDGNYVSYAEPGHPEHIKAELKDVLYINLNSKQ